MEAESAQRDSKMRAVYEGLLSQAGKEQADKFASILVDQAERTTAENLRQQKHFEELMEKAISAQRAERDQEMGELRERLANTNADMLTENIEAKLNEKMELLVGRNDVLDTDHC
jgi:hypothetical protein